MPVFALNDFRPELPSDESCWIAPGAMVIGQVRLSEGVSIWFNAVLRGDNEPISVGQDSNIQDGSVLHVDPGFPLEIGKRVTVGHMAMLHGCTIGDETLVGMGAMVMNGAVVGKNCLIGANAMVTEGKVIPDNSVVMGMPAKVVRTVQPTDVPKLTAGADAYARRREEYRKGLSEIG